MSAAKDPNPISFLAPQVVLDTRMQAEHPLELLGDERAWHFILCGTRGELLESQ